MVVLSATAHLVVITLVVGVSGPQPDRAAELNIQPVFYLAPPNRPLTDAGSGEQLRYVSLGGDGSGPGRGSAVAPGGDALRLALPTAGTAGETSSDEGASGDDEPVYTIVEVDEEAVRLATSAAPAYPPELLANGIEGTVIVRYVVDANGVADSASLQVISATRGEFVDAVRAALPYMRFTPARIGSESVRQLVEQPFSFRIRRATPAAEEAASQPPQKQPGA